jgi:hypothetical protein
LKGDFVIYFNRISRVWVVDQVDFFLLTALFESVVASRLKEYQSEKKR